MKTNLNIHDNIDEYSFLDWSTDNEYSWGVKCAGLVPYDWNSDLTNVKTHFCSNLNHQDNKDFVFVLNVVYAIKLVLMAQRLAHRDWRSGGPRFKSHPRLTFQSWSSYQLNQLGSKAASDSTLKQLTTCGVSNICTFFLSKNRQDVTYLWAFPAHWTLPAQSCLPHPWCWNWDRTLGDCPAIDGM